MSRFTLAVVAVVAGLFIVDKIELIGPSRISLKVMTMSALIGGGINWITNLTMKKRNSLFGSEGVLVILICGSVFALILFWEHLVNKYVPEPYLDEVFHIPQAQRYCQADFTWDDKITTPPGLYVVSIGLMKAFMTTAKCRVSDLRATNGLLLCLLGAVALVCRYTIETLRLNSSRPNSKASILKDYNSAYAIHTAVNIILFPPLFFFSGLYYTDVISTCVVLLAYSAFLKNQGLPIIRKVNKKTSTEFSLRMSSGLMIFLLGLGALTMRQTNIFWVAVFLGGLDIVRLLKTLLSSTTPPKASGGNIFDLIRQQADEGVIDPPLRQSTVFDWISCVYSIAITALFNFRLVALQLWSYIGMIAAFVGFVVWNGGVVLGDKSNHVATIHLPQMLYIWAFFAFFSAPLLYPYAIETLIRFSNIIMGSSQTATSGAHKSIQHQTWFKAILTVAALCVTLAIVHFNTIIHPFTLADNRHYVFYVFRYTILRHPLIKYALAPVYLGCAWLAFLALAGPERPNTKNMSTSKKTIEKTAAIHGERSIVFNPPVEQDITDTSFVIIWLISTALSLITAPLVEPRYFIIPWTIWRLHVPALPANASETGKLKYWAYAGHDHRLWLETFWFLAINAVTGWVFLYKGFEWPQEPGLVQRFMW